MGAETLVSSAFRARLDAWRALPLLGCDLTGRSSCRCLLVALASVVTGPLASFQLGHSAPQRSENAYLDGEQESYVWPPQYACS